MGDQIENVPLVTRRQIMNRINALPLVVDERTKQKILDSIPKEKLKLVYEAKDDDWLPVRLFMEINDHICSEIGEEGSYNLSLKSFDRMIASSTIGQLLRSTLTLLKVNPLAGVKLYAQFWKSIYRNHGGMTFVEKGPNQTQIIISDLPLFVVTNRYSLMAFAGGIHAIFSFSGYEAKVVLDKQSIEKGEASYIATWCSK